MMIHARMRIEFALGLALMVVSGCAPGSSVATHTCNVRSASAVVDRLYFGTSMPGNGNVNLDAWNTFLAEVVTPAFPKGFTAWQARGQWQADSDPHAIVREESYVLEIVHLEAEAPEAKAPEAKAPEAKAVDASIEAIREQYRRRFKQESVLRVTARVCVSF